LVTSIPPAADSSIAARTFWYGNLGNDELFPNFNNGKADRGVDFPTKTFGTNRSLFCLIQTPNEGLYFEMSDPTLPYYLEYTFEQHPGVVHGSVVPKPTSSPAGRCASSSTTAISYL
jgi:hypothetical protein